MRCIFFLFTCLLCCAVSFGQSKDSTRKANIKQTLFKGSHFSFSIIPYLSQKAKTTRESGDYPIHSNIMHGLEAGGNYHINFGNHYSLIIGLHGGACARTYSLFIRKEEFTPQLTSDVLENTALTRIYDFYKSAPVWFEKRWQCKNGSHWNALAGINVRFYPDDVSEGEGSYYNDVNGQQVEVTNLDLIVSHDYKPWLNYNLGGGYSFLLKNANFLRLNLLANASYTRLVKGDYQINVTGKEPTTGKYSANLGYLGFAIDYVFTGTNKRLRHLYEKELHYR